jgi:hypothetical protein
VERDKGGWKSTYFTLTLSYTWQYYTLQHIEIKSNIR